jgi:hypothetical protein
VKLNHDINNLLGKSIFSKDLNAFMKEYKLQDNIEIERRLKGAVWSARVINSKENISLDFIGSFTYHQQYEKFKPDTIIDKEEYFLNEITIGVNNKISSENSILNLPFNLLLADKEETVLKKLGKKIYDKSNTDYGYCFWTQYEEFKILTGFNQANELIFIRLMKLKFEEKEIIKLKKNLIQQNKNIKQEFPDSINLLKGKSPTIKWRKRKLKGDDIFTEKAITEVEQLLIKYLQTLTEFTEQKKASNIYNSVKKLTTAINIINNKNNSFIETIEREELCNFIHTAIQKTGFQIDKDIDLTADWREW